MPMMVDAYTLFVFLTMITIMFKLPVFERAYMQHQQHLQEEAWLHTKCQDPDFFAQMRHRNADMCADVQALFQQSAWWLALKECVPFSPQYCLVIGFIFCLFLLPTFLLPLYQAQQDRWEQQRIFRACSPSLIFHHGPASNNNKQHFL
jgi:hypothetical protein